MDCVALADKRKNPDVGKMINMLSYVRQTELGFVRRNALAPPDPSMG